MPLHHLGFNQKFNGILIDTNLLMLLLVGIFDNKKIEKFKRTQVYNISDYEKLSLLVLYCNDCIYTTPNILTELTNLTDNEVLNKYNLFFKFLFPFIDQFIEVLHQSSTVLHNHPVAFLKLGLADASIMNLASDDILTVTDDLKLYQFLSTHSKPVINYNHIRFM